MLADANGTIGDPSVTGIPFNDVYLYMDWLLTVPLLLLEILLVMDLTPEQHSYLEDGIAIASLWSLKNMELDMIYDLSSLALAHVSNVFLILVYRLQL